eukprot:1703113-Amphidinium_carterae.1
MVHFVLDSVTPIAIVERSKTRPKNSDWWRYAAIWWGFVLCVYIQNNISEKTLRATPALRIPEESLRQLEPPKYSLSNPAKPLPF